MQPLVYKANDRTTAPRRLLNHPYFDSTLSSLSYMILVMNVYRAKYLTQSENVSQEHNAEVHA